MSSIVNQLRCPGKNESVFSFGPFGKMIFPYHKMGAIDSLKLFDDNELLLFSFYWENRNKYQRVVDAGANLGLHSIALDRCGYKVLAYEPDPLHYAILLENLALNECNNVSAIQSAVSSKMGIAKFSRVLGNTTSSHITGSKANPYGEIETITVRTMAVGILMEWADLIKFDIEGHEAETLLATCFGQWTHTDALVEIENVNNAAAIYEHFSRLGVNLFSQKIDWKRVQKVEDIPFNYREGTLFITCSERMDFSEAV